MAEIILDSDSFWPSSIESEYVILLDDTPKKV